MIGAPHPTSVVARIGSHVPILARLYGYPRGTCTALPTSKFISPALPHLSSFNSTACIAPLLASCCDAHLAAGGGFPAPRG
jgi:hypothetical protein